uniref:Uncharacterized protein n=1 Tax=Ascaris lumbricoides TaxID=6252 RepID=A0A0M3I7P7_ASCLU
MRTSLYDQLPPGSPVSPCRHGAWFGRSVAATEHQTGLLFSFRAPLFVCHSLALQTLADDLIKI